MTRTREPQTPRRSAVNRPFRPIHIASARIDSKFTGTGTLAGKVVPQLAKYNVALGARYSERGWVGSAQVRVTGPQFEDDQNLFTLRRPFSRPVRRAPHASACRSRCRSDVSDG